MPNTPTTDTRDFVPQPEWMEAPFTGNDNVDDETFYTEADAYDGDAEAHYCDFPLCPCDDNQNRLLAESNAYYAEDIELERRMGWDV